MNKAAELLDHSDLLVKQVSAEVGYEDAFHFSRVFKRFLGISPRDFRRLRTRRGAIPVVDGMQGTAE